MDKKKLWSGMKDEEWREEKERIRKVQEKHTKSVKTGRYENEL